MSKKNRINQLRNIVVNGKDYKWMVEKVDGVNVVKIWNSEKKLIREVANKEYLTIYPKLVKEFIEGSR